MTSTAIRTTRRHTVLLTTLAVVSALILHRIDLPILPALHPSDALEFINEFGALQVSLGLIRLAALVAAWYVVAITSLALIASLRSGRNAFTPVIEALTIPPLKTLVSGLFGVGIIIMPLTATMAAPSSSVSHGATASYSGRRQPLLPTGAISTQSTTTLPGLAHDAMVLLPTQSDSSLTTIPDDDDIATFSVNEPDERRRPVAPASAEQADANDAAPPTRESSAPLDEIPRSERSVPPTDRAIPDGKPIAQTDAAAKADTRTRHTTRAQPRTAFNTKDSHSTSERSRRAGATAGRRDRSIPQAKPAVAVAASQTAISGRLDTHASTGASAGSPQASPRAAVNADAWVVQPGDHLWHIAVSTLATTLGHAPSEAETVSYWTQLIETNRSRLVDPNNPDLILPEQIFELPPR